MQTASLCIPVADRHVEGIRKNPDARSRSVVTRIFQSLSRSRCSGSVQNAVAEKWECSPTAVWPIFDAGRMASAIRLQRANLQGAELRINS